MAGPSIIARLGLDSGEFREGLSKAKDDVTNVAGQMAGVLGAAFGAGAFAQVAEYAEQVDNLSKKFGISVEAVQQWDVAAKATGRTVDEISDSWESLQEAVVEAMGGDEDMIESFEKLGVTLDDIKKNSIDGIMRKMADGTLDASTMMEVFGEAGVGAVDVLRQINTEAAQAATVMSGETVEALLRVKNQLGDIGQTVTISVGGAFSTVFNLFEDWVISVSGMWTDFVDGLKEDGKLIKAIFTGDLKGAKEAWENLGQLRAGNGIGRQTAAEELLARREAREASGDKGNTLLVDSTKKAAEKAKELAKSTADAYKEARGLEDAWEQIADETQKAKDEATTSAAEYEQAWQEIHENEEKAKQEREEALASAQAETTILQAELSGREDIAEQLKIQKEFQEKIAEAIENGNTALAEELTKQQGITAELAKQRREKEAAETKAKAREKKIDRKLMSVDERRTADRTQAERDRTGRAIDTIESEAKRTEKINKNVQAPDVFSKADPRKNKPGEWVGPVLPDDFKPRGGGDPGAIEGGKGANDPNAALLKEVQGLREDVKALEFVTIPG